MKVAIVAPSPIPFTPGGAEGLWSGLYRHLLDDSPHDVELIKIPVKESTLPEVMTGYEDFSRLDLSHFDLVVTGKYPAWMIQHPRHVVYLLHPLRGLYDAYHYFAEPESESWATPQVAELVATAQGLTRAGLPAFFDQWREVLATTDPASSALRFPGPLAWQLVHAMDAVGLSADAVERHCAISRTVAERAGYFPAGVTATVLYPPSDLTGLHGGAGEYFFTASRHDGPKRLDLLIDGMKRYQGDKRLVIAGTGPLTADLVDRAAGDPRISFAGRVPTAELVEHYSRAVGVPFIPVDEDLGYITIEAMASGKPVLTATDSGGPTEFIVPGVTGVVVTPDATAIGRGLAELEQLAASPSVAAAAARTVAPISWSAVVDGLLGDGPSPSVGAEADEASVGSGRPRIVVTSTFPIWPPRNGGQMRIFHLYSAVARDLDVEIICQAPPSTPPSLRQIAPGVWERVVPRTPAHDAAEMEVTHRVGLPVTDVVAGRLTPVFSPQYVAALRAAAVGAVGVVLADPFLHPTVLAARVDLPVVLDAFNCELVLKRQSFAGRDGGDALIAEVEAVEGAAARAAAAILTVSDDDRDELIRLYGVQREVFTAAPNGVDIPGVAFTSTPTRRLLREQWIGGASLWQLPPEVTRLAVFLGSWHPPNNEAARAIISMAPALPEVGFVLIGSHTGSLRRCLLPQNVLPVGEVSDGVKRSLLASADVALAPLTSGSGTNLKIVEYLAAGVPVVSTPFGMRGVRAPAGVVRTSQIGHFPEAIRAVLDRSEAVAAPIAVRGRLATEENYDWRAIAARCLPRLREVFGLPS